jgi:hypothetical protein
MLIAIDTPNGLRKIRVCSYCKTVCIASGFYCSSRCYHEHGKQMKVERQRMLRDLSTFKGDVEKEDGE